MRRFTDPALFTDPLTAQLRELGALSGRLSGAVLAGEPRRRPDRVRRVARGRADGRRGLAGVRDRARAHRLAAGGVDRRRALPRAAGAPLLRRLPARVPARRRAATVLLALRRRERGAALTAGGGALFYPPAALLAVGVLCVSALRGAARPRRPRAAHGGARGRARRWRPSLVPAAALRRLGRRDVASEARRYPEFGEHGDLHFFADSLLDYLRQNRSGFDLRATGSLLLLAALGLLARPARATSGGCARRCSRMPVVALAAWALAQAVLFRLYLPHRYTYPLLAFCAIAIAVDAAADVAGAGGPAAPSLARSRCCWRRCRSPYVALTRSRSARMRAGARSRVVDGRRPRPRSSLAAALVRERERSARCSPALALVAAVLALPGPRAAGPDLPAHAGDAVPRDAAEGRGHRGRPDGPQVRAGGRQPPGGDLDPARVLLRAGLLPRGPRADVRDAARLLRAVGRALTGLERRYGATHLLVNRGAVRRERAGERARWPRGRAALRRARPRPAARRASRRSSGSRSRCRRWHHGAAGGLRAPCL